MGFELRHDQLQQWPVVEVVEEGACRMRVALRGATLLCANARAPDGRLVELIDGYREGSELATLDAARSALMAPFSNRINEGRYRFDGDLLRLPVVEGEGHAMHGVVRGLDWRLRDAVLEPDHAELVFETRITPRTLNGYPFEIICLTSFSVDRNGLSWSFEARNLGRLDAPFGCGWHPYLLPPGGDLDACRVRLPVCRRVVCDARRIPLPGDEAYAVCDETELALAGRALDDCFYDLEPDADGWLRTRLEAPDCGLAVVLAQPSGAVQLYTGDSLGPRRRQSIAIEPTEFPPDSFNRDEFAAALRLAPGARRSFGARLSLEALA